MLIIDQKYVIAHMKKCGGTSVCSRLIEALPSERIEYLGYTPEGEEKSAKSRRRGGLWKHSSAPEIVSNLPYTRSDLTVFLVSLRPWWDRTASFYSHARRYNQLQGKYAWVEEMDFTSFLKSDYLGEVEKLDDFSMDQNGQLQVDFFIEYDGLDEWFADFATRLGLGELTLPFYNVGSEGKNATYKQIFKGEDMALLRDHFSGEVDLLSQLQPAGPGVRQIIS